MATKIISNAPKIFNPVKIEMEFTSREQLATFVQLIGNPTYFGTVLAQMTLSHPADHYADHYADIIDSFIDTDTYRELNRLINQ